MIYYNNGHVERGGTHTHTVTGFLTSHQNLGWSAWNIAHNGTGGTANGMYCSACSLSRMVMISGIITLPSNNAVITSSPMNSTSLASAKSGSQMPMPYMLIVSWDAYDQTSLCYCNLSAYASGSNYYLRVPDAQKGHVVRFHICYLSYTN